MVIERATTKDLKQIHALIEMCSRGEFAKKGWTCESDLLGGIRITEESLRNEMNAGNFLTHSDGEGKIIGCIYTRVIPQEKTLYVGMLSVHPLLQSQGLGTKLMAAAEALAREERCSKLFIYVITKRRELIDWYERHGYICSGEFTPYLSMKGVVGVPKLPIEFGKWVKNLE